MKAKHLLILLFLTFLSLKADAQFKNYIVKGGIQYQQVLPFSEYKGSLSFLGRAFVGFEVNNFLSLELGGGFGYYKTDDDVHVPVGTTVVGQDYFVKTEVIPIDARFKFTPNAARSKNWNPYFYIGIGLLKYKVTEITDVELPYYNTYQNNWTAFIPVGIGTEIKMSNHVLLDLSAGGYYSLTDNLNTFVDGSLQDAAGHLAVGLTFTGGANPNLDDDNDGLSNDREEQIGTDPENPDTDGDGLMDGPEVITHLTNPLNRDTDGDLLTDGEEVLNYRTNPLSKDTDSDNLTDYDEVKTYLTIPTDSDTDDDGLIDGDEVLRYRTNPKIVDTDLGSIGDGVEVGRGTDPLNPNDDLPPEPPEEEVKIGTVIILEGINFASGSAEISAGSEDVLEKALKSMKNNPAIVVEISGHTDSRSGHAYNMELSRDRAESVKSWLIANGISGSRIETVGYGPDQPIATNDTEEGRLRNRRIEFKRIR